MLSSSFIFLLLCFIFLLLYSIQYKLLICDGCIVQLLLNFIMESKNKRFYENILCQNKRRFKLKKKFMDSVIISYI